PAIAHVDLLIVNEGEAADLGGVDAIRAGGAHEVVVTLGSRGARAGGVVVPSPPITAVDATGAGDAFCAALTLAIVEGQDLRAATRFATATGAAACLHRGAADAMPTRAEVERLLADTGMS
ncbi:MAG: PfkB family carbohydrate kinase, partial [Candidatus Dormiibacterota bacterium]